MHSDMARQTRACGTGRTYSSAFTLLAFGVQVEASPSVAVAMVAFGRSGALFGFSNSCHFAIFQCRVASRMVASA